VTNIFVGNLDFAVTDGQLRDLFAAYGVVESVTVMMDRDSGQSRGFAFVEMTKADEAQAAIGALDGMQLNNRALRVNEARPKLEHGREDDSFRGRDHRRHRM
jgi:RNA recognition motif-containing protein